MRCRKYLGIAFGCMTPKNNLRSWYANGEGSNCAPERSNLYMCMRLKLMRFDARAEKLAENGERNQKQMALAENHFWTARQEGERPASWPEKTASDIDSGGIGNGHV